MLARHKAPYGHGKSQLIFLMSNQTANHRVALVTGAADRIGATLAKVLAANGSPEEVISWEASGENYDSWFYWSKKKAFHFKSGIQLAVSDWSKGPGAAK